MTEAAEFDRLHGIGTKIEHSIFTDRDPATSIKGCGFRNRATALQTLLLVEQPGTRYKQYWTIRAMLERAKRHPVVVKHTEEAQTSSYQVARANLENKLSPAIDMLEAISVFEAWLQGREETPCDQSRFDESEMALRTRFAMSKILNRHGGSAEEERLHGPEMQRQLREDQVDGKRALRQAALEASNSMSLDKKKSGWFALAGPAFSSIFGGPGVHAYGTLRELSSDQSNDVARSPGSVDGKVARASGGSGSVIDIKQGKGSSDIVKLVVSVRAAGPAMTLDAHAKCTNSTNSNGDPISWLKDLQVAVGVEQHSLVERESIKRPETLSDPGGLWSLGLGKPFHDWESFELEYDVLMERARFLTWKLKMEARQPSVLDFFGRKRLRQSESEVVAVENERGKNFGEFGNRSKSAFGRIERLDDVIVLSDSEG